jgi:hypothetical protein
MRRRNPRELVSVSTCARSANGAARLSTTTQVGIVHIVTGSQFSLIDPARMRLPREGSSTDNLQHVGSGKRLERSLKASRKQTPD